jgi:hypothetical protein
MKLVLLHALYPLSRKLDKHGPHLKDLESVKNMRQGGATWATRMVILGWTVNTLVMTVEIPPHEV